MNKHRCILFITIIMLMGWISSVNAQGRMGRAGKIFSKSEAGILFGKVQDSYQLSKAEIRKLLLMSGDYLLVSIKNKKVVFANERRKSINSTNSIQLDSRTQLFIFSREVINEFLDQSESESVTVESRDQTITLTSGTYTLEMSLPCPPLCWD